MTTTTTIEAPAAAAALDVSVVRPILERALAEVVRLAPSRPHLPVLGCVRIDADAAGLTLTATDLDVTMATRTSADVEGEGTAIVPARQLAELVKLLPLGAVRLALGADGLVVTGGESRTTLPSLPADEWPAPVVLRDGGSIELSGDVLVDIAHRVAFAVSTEPSRPVLNGILAEIREHTLTMVATNGHRLARAAAILPAESGAEADLIVPPRALDALVRLADGADVRLTWDRNQVRAETDAGSVQARLIGSSYPNYRQVIPDGADGWLTVGREALVRATRRALVTAPDSGRVTYDVEDGAVRLTSESDGRTHAETVSATYDGEPIRIAFNGAYLTEILPRITTWDVRIGLTDPRKAALIEPSDPDPDEPSGGYLLMPMQRLD